MRNSELSGPASNLPPNANLGKAMEMWNAETSEYRSVRNVTSIVICIFGEGRERARAVPFSEPFIRGGQFMRRTVVSTLAAFGWAFLVCSAGPTQQASASAVRVHAWGTTFASGGVSGSVNSRADSRITQA